MYLSCLYWVRTGKFLLEKASFFSRRLTEISFPTICLSSGSIVLRESEHRDSVSSFRWLLSRYHKCFHSDCYRLVRPELNKDWRPWLYQISSTFFYVTWTFHISRWNRTFVSTTEIGTEGISQRYRVTEQAPFVDGTWIDCRQKKKNTFLFTTRW